MEVTTAGADTASPDGHSVMAALSPRPTVRRLTASRPSPAVERRLTTRMVSASVQCHTSNGALRFAVGVWCRNWQANRDCGRAAGRALQLKVSAARFRPIDHALEAEPLPSLAPPIPSSVTSRRTQLPSSSALIVTCFARACLLALASSAAMK